MTDQPDLSPATACGTMKAHGLIDNTGAGDGLMLSYSGMAQAPHVLPDGDPKQRHFVWHNVNGLVVAKAATQDNYEAQHPRHDPACKRAAGGVAHRKPNPLPSTPYRKRYGSTLCGEP
ncbi:hypothetical protein [Paracoccus aminophilus]|uniref:hypothetical protein n=1 Tax=Paracoccus aminophilus TaxID=34003 RepID=UPI0011DE1A0B|nr:hypothetical protein [Paracoccus aminophilus]